MEYVDGEPLSRWVEMYHPISDSLLLEILCQMLDGITALHEIDAIHRDLKPSNVMLSEDFLAKVMDLGVVRLTSEKIGKLTPSDQFLATIRNSSPELLFGKKYDKRTDLYSFGTILYFLLHGEEVFGHERQFARLIELVRHDQPECNEALQGESATRSHLLDLCKRLALYLKRAGLLEPSQPGAIIVSLRRAESLRKGLSTETVPGSAGTCVSSWRSVAFGNGLILHDDRQDAAGDLGGVDIVDACRRPTRGAEARDLHVYSSDSVR